MRVVLLSDSPHMGGVNRYCLLLMEGLRRCGVDVHLACLSEAEHGWLMEVAAHEVMTIDTIAVTSFPRTVARLRRYVQGLQPDILHVQGYRSSIVGQFSTLGLGIPTVRTVHGFLPHLTVRLKLYDMFDRLSWRGTARLISVSRELAGRIKALGYRPERVQAVPNGVHVQEPVPRSERDPVIGWAGRLSPEKGTEQFAEVIRAVGAQCNRARFLIVGDGPERRNLEQAVQAANLSGRVTFAGEQQDMAPFFAQMDMLAMPSLMEGLPFALVEAMGTGMPAVVNAVGGMPEVVVDGQGGFVLESGDTAGFVTAIMRLVQDQSLRQSMGQRAHEHVRTHYSIDTMAEQTLEVYRGLLSTK